jgi:regulator of sigma E protease
MTLFLVIIGFAILIFVHELGHFGASKLFNIKVEKFGIGFPPKIVSKKIGETEYSINLLPLGGFVKIYGEDSSDVISEDDRNRSFSHQSAWKRAIVLVSGVGMNIILGWMAFTVIVTTGIPEHLMITEVAVNSPAYESEIEAGDVIVKAQVGDVIINDPINSSQLIELTKTNLGETVSISIKRGDEIINKNILIRDNPPDGEGAMGVALVDIGAPPVPFPKNIVEGFTATTRSIDLVARGFYSLITGIFTNPKVVDSVSGPVGIVSMATRVGDLGIIYLVQLMAIISLNLAVLNLIPFPALDGGQLLILAIEKFIGRDVPFRIKYIVNTVGIVALLLLMIVVTIKDIGVIIK